MTEMASPIAYQGLAAQPLALTGPRPWIALLTCPDLPQGGDDATLLREAVQRAGATLTTVVWSDLTIAWGAFDAIVPLYAWDYGNRPSSFRGWLSDRERERAFFVNHCDMMRWCLDKAYLLALAEQGIPTPRTLLRTVGMHTPGDWPADSDLVRKPRKGTGGIGVERVTPETWTDPREDVLVQPYLATIEHFGELSVVLIDGRATHAVRRLPASGDYRVQDQWGGSVQTAELTDEMAEAALKVAELLPGSPAYCRVDLWEHNGQLLLSEIDLFEPDLFLRHHPPAADRLARAIISRCRSVDELGPQSER